MTARQIYRFAALAILTFLACKGLWQHQGRELYDWLLLAVAAAGAFTWWRH